MIRSSSGSPKGFVAGLCAVALILAGCSSNANDAASNSAPEGQSPAQSQSATASDSASASASASASKKASESASASASSSASSSSANASSGNAKKPSSSASSNSSNGKKPSSSYNMNGGKATAKPSASTTKKPGYTISPRISVSKTKGLKNGEYVTVTGTGFDNTKGIYIAFCVITGGKPTPCGGGADTDGDTNKSEWISSNPPTYGKALAKPYGANGSFTVRIKVSESIGSFDCSTGGCGVATRADHTRSSDRSADRWIKITFA